jgi:hypothetical protein
MAWIEGLFEKAKALATMEKILVHYGIRFRAVRQLSNLPCPLPTHPHEKGTKGSLSVNFVTDEWLCWNKKCAAFREGQRLGNPLGFVMSMENCSAREAAQNILEWFGSPEMQKPPLQTEALAQKSTNPRNENITDIPEIQGNSQPRRVIGFQPEPAIGEKIPAEPELRSSGGAGTEPVPLDNKSRNEAVKVKGHMKEVDEWFDSLISEPPDWRKIRNAVKERLIQSFKNGKAAGS